MSEPAPFPGLRGFPTGAWGLALLCTAVPSGRASPHADFVSDAARWTFASAALSSAGIGTMTGCPDAIDHILLSNEASTAYVAGSVEAYKVDAYIPAYATSTSDQYPVLARFRPS